jgi:hypothetical protein
MENRGPFDVVVHGQVTRTHLTTLDEAREAAKVEKQRNPNKQVNVRDRFGVSTSVEDCP